MGQGAATMAKLTTLKPGLSILPNRLAPSHANEAERSRYRDATQAWRAWYRSEQWRRLRWHVLVRDQFTCQWPGCGKLEGNTRLLIGHHKRREYKLTREAFFNEANVICVCRDCHDGPIQKAEQTLPFLG